MDLARFLAKLAIAILSLNFVAQADSSAAQPAALTTAAPTPLLDETHPAQWIFIYKFFAGDFSTKGQLKKCAFSGDPNPKQTGQKYVVASSISPALADGNGLIGTSTNDPLGATFDEIYNGKLNFVVWNDEFRNHPMVSCGPVCGGHWAHSKGTLAWDDAGNGIIVQVSTPGWPGSGSSTVGRQGEGNTLGCIKEPNNVEYGQHFFALQLSPSDTATVLDALANSSVVTDIHDLELAHIGGPPEIVQRANALGQVVQSSKIIDVQLSSGVRLLSKPSYLEVPPWQFVSAELGAVPLRTSTWWLIPRIRNTSANDKIVCWSPDLASPGPVQIAKTGKWTKSIHLSGGGSHAKLGISLDPQRPLVIFGDENQQGYLGPKSACAKSQNGRGGLFFVVSDPQLFASMSQFLSGLTEQNPTAKPAKKAAARRAAKRARKSTRPHHAS